MRRVKIYRSLIFLMLFLASLIYGAQLVGAQQSPEISVPPLNPDFVNYLNSLNMYRLQQAPSEYGFGLIPSPLDLSHMKGQRPLTGIKLLGVAPSSYDLRTQGKLTAIRNQGNCGSCWSFGTYGSLESNLLPSDTSDFSENNLKNTHGFNWGPCDGGNAYMSTAYLARWDGPVNEPDDPYPLNPSDSDTSPSGLPERKHVQEVLIIPDRGGPLDNDNIKEAIMTYGAVNTSMYWNGDGGGGPSYSPAYYAYYYNGSSSTTNHSVAIVGWDDNFPASRFTSLPAGNGAFIIRNSWGTWGESGYFYISYYDTKVGTDNFVFNNAEPISNYTGVYQYDPLGWVSSFGGSSSTYWFANVFTAASSDSLAAVSFYTASLNSSYEIYVYTNVTSNPTSGSLAGSKTGTITWAGYHTIPLNALVPLTLGHKFSVVVKLTTPGYNYPIPIEYSYPGYSSAATSSPGQSYYSSSGTSWTDLTSWNSTANVCLKAFTNLPDCTSSSGDVYVNWGGSCGKNPCYSSIQSAINGAATCTSINVTGDTDEDLVVNKQLFLQGGWNSSFTGVGSNTTIHSLNITTGRLTIENLVLQ